MKMSCAHFSSSALYKFSLTQPLSKGQCYLKVPSTLLFHSKCCNSWAGASHNVVVAVFTVDVIWVNACDPHECSSFAPHSLSGQPVPFSTLSWFFLTPLPCFQYSSVFQADPFFITGLFLLEQFESVILIVHCHFTYMIQLAQDHN